MENEAINSSKKVRLTLKHQEADRVPFDLDGTGLSTIHATAYQTLRNPLGLPAIRPRVAFTAKQLAYVDEDLARRPGSSTLCAMKTRTRLPRMNGALAGISPKMAAFTMS